MKRYIRELICPQDHQGLESAAHQHSNYQHDGRIPSCPQSILQEVDLIHMYIVLFVNIGLFYL